MQGLTPDICVIGAGSGGLAAATAAAAFGASVVLVARDTMGDRPDAGILAAHALLATARRAEAMRNAASFGLKPPRVAVDFREVRAHLRTVSAAVAPRTATERLAGLGIRLVVGAARFTDARAVAVDDDVEIKARRFVIASDAVMAPPPIPGLDATPYLTVDTVAELTALPKQLIVIGAGSQGLALAQAFRRLGADVTVLDGTAPLPDEDPECVQIVLDQLEREGVLLRTAASIVSVAKARTRILVTLADGEAVEGTHLLVATARQPATAGLDLDKAGIATGPSGVVVDRRMRTTNKRVYAIGEVTGAPPLIHLAEAQAELVVGQALSRSRTTVAAVPRVTFTDPELAHVGLTEVQARAGHRHLRILRWPYQESDRAQAERATAGHIKVVTTARGVILGVTIAGAGAGEMIGIWALALARRLNIRAMTEFIVPYPTLAEISRRAAQSAFTVRLTSSFVRRIIAFFRWFG
jgi:pyruvate/2-oxoglutarate dehydrogenase complex dihydrolipoamide dehydrogenase (E3) component